MRVFCVLLKMLKKKKRMAMAAVLVKYPDCFENPFVRQHWLDHCTDLKKYREFCDKVLTSAMTSGSIVGHEDEIMNSLVHFSKDVITKLNNEGQEEEGVKERIRGWLLVLANYCGAFSSVQSVLEM